MENLYTAEGEADKQTLWRQYIPLVRHEALRLQVRLPACVDLDDLIQAGGIGLLNAIDRYDSGQGTAFTTYAVQRIRGAMLDELRSRDWVPRRVRREAREVASAIAALEQLSGQPVKDQDIADRMKISLADYRQILLETNTSQLFSLETLCEESGDSAERIMPHSEDADPFRLLQDGRLREQVLQAIDGLPEREKLVLSLYYQDELNLKEIGAVLNVGESRVSQLHSQAIKRLRARLKDN